jgi:PmbA protein
MDTNEKYALADDVVEHALKSGAEQVSVSVFDNRSTQIEIRDQKIDSLKESNQANLSISIYVDKKYSSHSTNRMNREELYRFVEEAIESTRFLASDEYRSLPDPELYYREGGPSLDIFDTSIDSLDAKTKIDLARKVMEEAYGKDERILSVSSYYYDSISGGIMVTSNGFRGSSANTGVQLVAEVSVKSNTGRPNAYWYESQLFYDKLKKEGIGSKALERALRKSDPRKINSGLYEVIVENRVAANLLSPLYDSLTGSSLYQKQSFLIGKQGKPVASEMLTAIDDPHIPSAPGSRLFDNEGLKSVKRPIIEKGILKDYYIDTYYGKKLGMKPTSGSSSNVVFETGTRKPEEMVAAMKKGVLITGFIGGNCNGSTGDFSYGIEGFYIENGSIIHPVNEMNIAGNMNQFWFNLKEMGSDIREDDSIRLPSMRFEGVQLSGI